MTDGHVWIQHLKSSLKASKQLAYLYHVNDDRFEFMGDIFGVLGCADDGCPVNKKTFSRFVAEEDLVTRQLTLADMMAQCVGSEKNFTLNFRMRHPDGTIFPVVETGIISTDEQSKKMTIQSLIAIDTETIDRRKKLNSRIGFREAISSSFSGNRERRSVILRLDEIICRTDRPPHTGYVLLVEVDRVSLINQVYGSNFTDELLEKTNATLTSMVGDRAEVVQIASDLFAVIFADGAHGEMKDTAQKILTVFYNQPIKIQERAVHQVLSIGGVKISDKTTSGVSLLGWLELALNDAKQKGRGCFIEYSDTIGQEVDHFREILTIGDSFLKNFKEGRVKMAFQSVISARTNDVSFYECLIRMVDADGEVHSAGNFINAVEKMGLTRLVDTFATKEAIRELKEFSSISLSVNVSNHTLTDPDWLKIVILELRDFPDVANRLIVEITESIAMNDMNQTIRVVRALHDLGCRVALDDFGAGNTSFSQIKDLSLDIVKIDKSFVREMNREENKHFIRTLHSLASSMNLETVAEGAETTLESDSLVRDGIDHIQGFVNGLPSMERLWLKGQKH